MSECLKASIDLWHGRLVSVDTADQNDWQVLDESERRRALSLKRRHAQARFVEVHGKTRRILARYLQVEPESIVIGKEAHGKPYLVERREWVFNLSHSADCFVLAVAKNCRLGVDLEIIKSRASLDGLVNKCFGREEAEYWKALPESEKNHEFYRFWTRKEAFVKATGRGIALGLDQCVVNPLNPGGMLRVPECWTPENDWSIADIDLGEGLVCCVVNDSGIRRVMMRHIDDELATRF